MPQKVSLMIKPSKQKREFMPTNLTIDFCKKRKTNKTEENYLLILEICCNCSLCYRSSKDTIFGRASFTVLSIQNSSKNF